MQHVPKQNSQLWLRIDLFSNEPPKALSGLAIIEPMTDSRAQETDGPIFICSRCKTDVTIRPKKKPPQSTIKQSSFMTATTNQKMLGSGQRQGVFNRLGLKTWVDELPPVRRCLDFDASFYNEDYYALNSSSSSSSASQENL